MIVYADTSALLKLYVAEHGSRRVQESVSAAAIICTHLITYTEVHAALAQAVRMERLSAAERVRQASAFEADWEALQVVLVDDPLVRRAAEHAERYGLRGYDSVHLAAAERTFDGAGRPAAFAFAAFDDDLLIGARNLGLPIVA